MAKPITRVYVHSQNWLFNAALQAVRTLGYKIDSIDKVNGFLSFKTGLSMKSWAGQEMSILIMDNGDGTRMVDISGKRSQSGVVIQIYDWGEAAGIAKKIFAKMDKFLERENKGKIISKIKETNLCVNCWLSGDCEREKKAIKKRKIITDCQSYFPENK